MGLGPRDLISLLAEAWLKHADQHNLTTGNCRWGVQQGEFVKSNFGAKYKTAQLYDLSKRVWGYLSNTLGPEALEQFTNLGEVADFQHADLVTLATLQNLHCFGKLVCNNLGTGSYPKALLSVLYIQGCRFLVPRLGIGSFITLDGID